MPTLASTHGTSLYLPGSHTVLCYLIDDPVFKGSLRQTLETVRTPSQAVKTHGPEGHSLEEGVTEKGPKNAGGSTEIGRCMELYLLLFVCVYVDLYATCLILMSVPLNRTLRGYINIRS